MLWGSEVRASGYWRNLVLQGYVGKGPQGFLKVLKVLYKASAV